MIHYSSLGRITLCGREIGTKSRAVRHNMARGEISNVTCKKCIAAWVKRGMVLAA